MNEWIEYITRDENLKTENERRRQQAAITKKKQTKKNKHNQRNHRKTFNYLSANWSIVQISIVREVNRIERTKTREICEILFCLWAHLNLWINGWMVFILFVLIPFCWQHILHKRKISLNLNLDFYFSFHFRWWKMGGKLFVRSFHRKTSNCQTFTFANA